MRNGHALNSSLRRVTLAYIKIEAFSVSAMQESTLDSKIIIRIVSKRSWCSKTRSAT